MKVTMKTIAQRAGVSINTVSQALRNMSTVKPETRDAVLQIAEDLGYLEARARADNCNIALVSTVENLQDSYFYMSFQQCILKNIQARGYNMTVYSSSRCEKSAAALRQVMDANAVCGLVLLGDMDPAIAETIADCGLPVVAIGTLYSGQRICSVIEDNLGGAACAVRYLYSCGYRRIGYAGHTPHSIAFTERYLGYIGAAMALGLPCPPAWSITRTAAEYDSDTFLRLLREMPVLPEAFVCANDNTAIVLTKALSACGLSVPTDVALVGFDNSLFGKMSIPSITSVDVQYARQAEIGIELLMRAIDKKEAQLPLRIALPCSIVEGDSVGQLP